MKNDNLSTAKKLAYFAILTALTVVLQLWASNIAIGPASLNFSLIPLVLCGMILGVWYATALGAVVGVLVLIPIITGQSQFFTPLFEITPVMIILICLIKTAAAGLLGGLLYKVIRGKNKYVATFVSALTVPTVNTLIFIIGMFIINGPLTQLNPLDQGQTLFGFIVVGLVSFNYFIELGLNLLLAPAIFRVIKAVDKQIGAE